MAAACRSAQHPFRIRPREPGQRLLDRASPSTESGGLLGKSNAAHRTGGARAAVLQRRHLFRRSSGAWPAGREYGRGRFWRQLLRERWPEGCRQLRAPTELGREFQPVDGWYRLPLPGSAGTRGDAMKRIPLLTITLLLAVTAF